MSLLPTGVRARGHGTGRTGPTGDLGETETRVEQRERQNRRPSRDRGTQRKGDRGTDREREKDKDRKQGHVPGEVDRGDMGRGKVE